MRLLLFVLSVFFVVCRASAIWSRHDWCEVKQKADAGDGDRNWKQVRETIRTAMLYDRRWPDDRGPLDLGGTLTAEEEQTQVLLWTVLRSPVRIVSGQKAKRPSTAALLGNARLKEVWADPMLSQAWVVVEENGGYVLLLDHGRIDSNVKIATFYNPCDRPVRLALDQEGMQLAGRTVARDVISGEPVEMPDGRLSLEVPAHGAKMVRITGEHAVMRKTYRGDAAIRRESGDDVVFRHVYAPKNGRYRLTVEPAGEGTYMVEVNGLPVREGCRGVSQTDIRLFSGHNFIRLSAQGPVMPAVNFIRVNQ